MRLSSGGRHLTLVAIVAVVGALGLAAATHSPARNARIAADTSITVGPATSAPAVPAGFLGLSIEYWAIEAYAGTNPRAINPVLAQLIRNITPGQRPVLRIGGVTTDKTWWPIAGFTRPRGVSISLNRRWMRVMRKLARAVDARLILGVNLEANSTTLASAEARAMLAGIGGRHVQAFELGNEPELYGNPNFGWYTVNGHQVPGRPQSYDFTAFTHDFTTIGGALPPTALAGPSSGGAAWFSHTGELIAAEPRLGVVTVHRYPLQACFTSPGSPKFPAIPQLLSPASSTGLADSVLPVLTIAHAHHLPMRIDEMNNISCGSPPGVSNTFAMALWALDALFADLKDGVDGVNMHTYPGAIYQLFKFNRVNSSWQGLVEPEYYGLLMFARAAPPGSHLLQISGASNAVRAWATQAPDGRIRVVLINDDTGHRHTVGVSVAAGHGAATVESLRAPGVRAKHGVTLGGQSFGTQTSTGLLAGQRHAVKLARIGSSYVVRLPAGSASMLTLR